MCVCMHISMDPENSLKDTIDKRNMLSNLNTSPLFIDLIHISLLFKKHRDSSQME